MKLIPISEHPDSAAILFDLLLERDETVNISHKKMPTWEQHLNFIASSPYKCWYLVEVESAIVGNVYLTHANEIGVFLFKEHQHRGYGASAVTELIEHHGPGIFLANINPANEFSQRMFERLGFRFVQKTYKLEVA
jgi:RimJ/RimL family protein N-acetyltransferase